MHVAEICISEICTTLLILVLSSTEMHDFAKGNNDEQGQNSSMRVFVYTVQYCAGFYQGNCSAKYGMLLWSPMTGNNC